MLSEVLTWNETNDQGAPVDESVPQGNDDWRGVWMIPSVGASAFTGKFPPNSTGQRQDFRKANAFDQLRPDSGVRHGTWQSSIPTSRTFRAQEDMSTANIWASARSKHNEGVNAAMGDGSVRFVADDIDAFVWHAMCTRAGSECRESVASRSLSCCDSLSRGACVLLRQAVAVRAVIARLRCASNFMISPTFYLHLSSSILHSQELNSHFLKFCHLVLTAEIEMRRKTKAALQGRFGRSSNRKGSKRSSAQRRSRLSFEPLETRNLLAVIDVSGRRRRLRRPTGYGHFLAGSRHQLRHGRTYQRRPAGLQQRAARFAEV